MVKMAPISAKSYDFKGLFNQGNIWQADAKFAASAGEYLTISLDISTLIVFERCQNDFQLVWTVNEREIKYWDLGSTNFAREDLAKLVAHRGKEKVAHTL